VTAEPDLPTPTPSPARTGARAIVATPAAPAAIGPYAQGVVAAGLVFTSMQLGLVPATGELAAGGVEAEARQVLENLSAILAAAGSSLAATVKATVYLVDLGDFAAVNGIYGTFFPTAPPARAAVGVAALPRGARVAMELVALGPV
jgi:2-iminobutanoate/2-iminopropanoate deaminase